VGAQGGSLQDVCGYGMNSKCGLIVNSSRGIIFADSSENFDKTAGEKAEEISTEMEKYLSERKLI
jgi:orotidine-5'-phosphate decarboxylase